MESKLKVGDQVQIIGGAWCVREQNLVYCQDLATVIKIHNMGPAFALNVELKTEFGQDYFASKDQLRICKNSAQSSKKNRAS